MYINILQRILRPMGRDPQSYSPGLHPCQAQLCTFFDHIAKTADMLTVASDVPERPLRALAMGSASTTFFSQTSTTYNEKHYL
jgi:hypothetical protein